MDIYRRLGVPKRVNGAGLLTRLGGSLMDAEVLEAMREAATAFIDMAELQTRASGIIAAHTGAEAGIVTGGASAALTLASCACLTGTDVALMERLPDTATMRNEIIIHRAHRTGYDHAIRAAGAKLVEIGFNDRGAGAGVRSLETWEIEAAITERTVAIAYTATPDMMPKLASLVAVAERRALPVIVDAAAQLPPKENLRRFIGEGAALVCFSGGKALRGPQGTGILCGREKLVAAALIQMLDMDILPETWMPPDGLLARHFRDRFPHHGLGRGFKVDKESLVGLLTAFERFAAADIAAEVAARAGMLRRLADAIADLPGCRPRELKEGAGSYPTLDIEIDAAKLGRDAYQVSLALKRHDPPVHLGERLAAQGVLSVASAGLQPGDEALVAQAFRQICGASR